ncbi:MAG TPA: SMC-Scp complex subunit ScpB, partial [Candidatus Methylacidiphilales bacterium]
MTDAADPLPPESEAETEAAPLPGETEASALSSEASETSEALEMPSEVPAAEETEAAPRPSGLGADLRQVVEALLFASSKALTPRQLLNILTKRSETDGPDWDLFKDATEDQVIEAIVQIRDEYADAVPSRGLHLQQIAGGFRFGTRPETATWVRQLFDETRPAKLSQPALETLSIIAYRQPISRADVEAVRGVAIDGVVATLLERRLIKLAGRSEAPGRPLLYETTPEFLETFGLKALDELPNADELRRIPLPVQPATPVSRAEADENPVPADAAAKEGEAANAEASAPEAEAEAETAVAVAEEGGREPDIEPNPTDRPNEEDDGGAP